MTRRAAVPALKPITTVGLNYGHKEVNVFEDHGAHLVMAMAGVVIIAVVVVITYLSKALAALL